MSTAQKQTVEAFLTAIGHGEFPEHLVTADMKAWTLTSGDSAKEKFVGGIRALGAVFGGSLRYLFDELVEEGNKVIAEVHSEGTFTDGTSFTNRHVFIFHFDGDKVSRVAEYMNPIIVQEQLLPQLQKLMQR